MNLRILFCAPEVAPFAKTGGLADVAGALPLALRGLGCDVRIFMPFYRCVRERMASLTPLEDTDPISVGIHDYRVNLWQGTGPSDVPVYFLEKDEFYDRTYLYGTPTRGDYEDNAERYITFSRAVRSLCTALDWFPSIFHLHDWQTALVAAYLRFSWRDDADFSSSRTVFTIHNLAYQGLFPASHFDLTDLPAEVFSIQGMEFWKQCSFLKAGLVYSDFLTTVSPQYSQEIQQPEFGCGLEGILKGRSDRLSGILNGIDCSAWNPEADPMIPAHFNAEDLSGKRVCKEALLLELGFPRKTSDRPLLGMIGRLATQKGFDLLSEILEDLMKTEISLVILGTGDARIEEELQTAATLYRDKLRLLTKFDEALAHRIEAGADMFLMPSRYEPCGLNQMYSLRYGTIPVVHATGGLQDSVVDVLQHPKTGTGFKFYKYEADAFLEVVLSALGLFKEKGKWRKIQLRAMAQDFSWDRSARAYLQIYERVLGDMTP